MYKVHRGAKLLEIDIDTKKIGTDKDKQVDKIYALASEKDGIISLNLVNTSMTEADSVAVELPKGVNYAGGQILCGETVDTYNSVENPDAIVAKEAKAPVSEADGSWSIEIPAASVAVYSFKL
jgi:alpha-N-arabinofuranosidase